MSSIIIGVLKVTVGLLINKLRDQTANRLTEGDLTDEKCRQLIVRELDDMKTKLDALIRQHLLSAVEFFRDGMNYLEMTIQDPNPSSSQAEISVEGVSPLGIGVVAQLTIEGSNVTSEGRYRKAKEKFKTAGEEATRAFSNPAVSVEEKILATKLRIACSMLEGMREDVEAAVKAAIMYLERLHALPGIKEAFSVYLDGGIKSLFNKAKRLEIVQAVSIINLELFHFSRMVAKSSINLFSWPKIELPNRGYQPILRDSDIPLAEYGVTAQCPFHTSFGGVKVNPWHSAVNSQGDVIADVGGATIYTFFAKPTNKMDQHVKMFSLPEEHKERTRFAIYAIAIDANDNLYAITIHHSQTFHRTLYMFTSIGILKHQCQLEFLQAPFACYKRAGIAVNNLGEIVMNEVGVNHIYTFNSDGQLLREFPKVDWEDSIFTSVYLTTSDSREIIAAHYEENIVYVYTAEGKYKRAFSLPEEHTIAGVAFDQMAKSIILLTTTVTTHSQLQSSQRMHLLSYAPNAVKPQMLHLENIDTQCHLTAHLTGPVSVIAEHGAIFI